MTPPKSIVGTVARTEIMRRPWRRRGLFAVLIVIFLVLALFPQKYRAVVTMTPTDQNSLGLGGALGQLGAINSVFGNQAAIELALKVARSMEVRQVVTQRLQLAKRMSFHDPIAADRWLTGAVTIRSLRGGMMQIEMANTDSMLAKNVISAFAEATRAKLGEISRRQTAYKRDILTRLVGDANERFANAQTAYNDFRLRNQTSEPSLRLSEVGLRIEGLRRSLRDKEVDLNAARQFATDDNMNVRQILAEMEAVRNQLREAETSNPEVSNSVGRVILQSGQLTKLERELATARSLRDSYTRFLEGAAVEDLTSTANVRIIEEPFVDSARQYNLVPAGCAILLLLLALAIEFYSLRPPSDGLLVPE